MLTMCKTQQYSMTAKLTHCISCQVVGTFTVHSSTVRYTLRFPRWRRHRHNIVFVRNLYFRSVENGTVIVMCCS